MDEGSRAGATPIVVVHGVGKQKRGVTSGQLADQLAKAAYADDADRSTAVHSSTSFFCYDEEVVQSVPMATVDGPNPLKIYEFYWADESGMGSGFAQRLRGYWQILVGLPRIGLRCLEQADVGKATVLAYCVAWGFIVCRLLAATAAVVVQTIIGRDYRVACEIVLPFDLLLSSSLVCLSVCIAYETKCLLRRNAVRLSVYPIVTSLLLCQAATIAISWAFLDSQPSTRLVTAEPLLWPFPTGYTANWFYAPNTLSGFGPYLTYALIGFMFVTIAKCLLRERFQFREGDSAEDDSPGENDSHDGDAAPSTSEHLIGERLVTVCGRWLIPISISCMLVSPILDLFDFLMIFVFGKQTIHFGGPDDSWLVSAFAHGVTWIIAVVLVTPQFRELLGPIEELCLDLINYVPSIPLTDRSPVIRFILGGRRGPEEGSLEEELPLRLQDLLKTVVRRHGGRVLLIGHSLGSIIALRALQEPATKVDESDNCDYDVNLVTMGSPLEFLTEAYPNTYPEKFVLKSTSTWENLFTSGDVIGRCLDKSIWTNGNLDNTYVGPGGHVGYFDDPAVASRLATRFG